MSRNRFCSSIASLFVFVMLPACGSSDSTPPAPAGPTFTRVTQEVMTNLHCGGPLCHSSNVGGFKITSNKDSLYGDLINKPAAGAKCSAGAIEGGTQSFTLVVPDKPEESLLYLKIDHAPPCGDPMPVSGTLTEAEITLVHDWIAAGAKND